MPLLSHSALTTKFAKIHLIILDPIIAKIANIIIMTAIIVTSQSILARSKSSENILDKLEQRLLDQEREALSFDSGLSSLGQKPADTSFKFRPKYIDELTPSNQDLKKLAATVTDLESQTEYLASRVQRIKQHIYQDATIDTLVDITTQVEQKDQLTYRSLDVSIDGEKVYQHSTALGLWIPEDSIPLYRGPMQPGAHRIDFEARLIQKQDKGLPIQSNTYNIIKETYRFDVSKAPGQKKWVILLKGGSKQDESASAEFKALPWVSRA